jgi:hypothetical protein
MSTKPTRPGTMNDGLPAEDFQGSIGTTYRTAKPWWPPRVQPPAGAPPVPAAPPPDNAALYSSSSNGA